MADDKMLTILRDYPNGVLSGIDADGYPLSLRCQPKADATGQRFIITVPDNVPVQAGKVSLLFHYHDELLNNLRSVSVQGTLQQQGDQWLFQPEKILPGLGTPGFFQTIRDNLLTPRRNAKNYLQKHNLPRPTIPWQRLRKIVAEIGGK